MNKEELQKKAIQLGQIAIEKIKTKWESGPRGKAICAGTGVGCLIVLICLFGSCGKSSPQIVQVKNNMPPKPVATHGATQSNPVDLANTKSDVPELGEEANTTILDSTTEVRPVQVAAQTAEEAVAVEKKNENEEKEIDEEDSDIDSSVKDAFSGVRLWRNNELSDGGVEARWKPTKKVSYDAFSKGYYAIEDAFLPKLIEYFRMPNPYLSEELMVNMLPRADHLISYCTGVSLESSTSKKEKKLFLAHVVCATKVQNAIFSYAVALGHDSREQYAEAKKEWNDYLKIRNILPAHTVDPKASENYVLPMIPVDADKVAEKVVQGIRRDMWDVSTRLGFRRRGDRDVERENKYKARTWKPYPIVKNYPISEILGIGLGQTLDGVSANLGKVLFVEYKESPTLLGELKKPLGPMDTVYVHFASRTHSRVDEYTPLGPDIREIEAAYRISIQGEISAEEYSRASCLETLMKLKSMIEKKFKVNLGKGNDDKSCFATGLPGGGYVALGLVKNPMAVPAVDGGMCQVEDSEESYCMFLEIEYASEDKMLSAILKEEERRHAARKAQAEQKKKRLDVSIDGNSL